MLFCLGFLTVGIILCQTPQVIQLKGDQVFRSMWASITLLAAMAVSNIIAMGSSLRGSGAKKAKFRVDYHSSGTTSRSGRDVTTGAPWNDLGHAKAQQQLHKMEIDEGLKELDSRPPRQFIRKMNRHSSPFSGKSVGRAPRIAMML